jgi:hypothetical protein
MWHWWVNGVGDRLQIGTVCGLDFWLSDMALWGAVTGWWQGRVGVVEGGSEYPGQCWVGGWCVVP